MKIIKYIKKKEFKKLKKENDNIKVIGQTKLSKWKEDKHSKKEGYLKLEDPQNEKEYLVKPKVYGFISKYIKVGKDEYVEVKYKFLIIILLLLLAGLLGTGLALWLNGDLPKLPDIQIGGQDIEEYDPEFEPHQDMIEVPGLSQEYRVDKKNKELYLVNPERNTVFFKYIVEVNGGEKLYESNYIPPNKMEKVDLYSKLSAGKYDLIVTIKTIDKSTYAECNSVELETTVNVIK